MKIRVMLVDDEPFILQGLSIEQPKAIKPAVKTQSMILQSP